MLLIVGVKANQCLYPVLRKGRAGGNIDRALIPQTDVRG